MNQKTDQLLKKIEKDAPVHGSIPFWSWNDRLCEADLRRQIRDMHALGMRGFFMHARGGLETEYMSKEWFDAVRACVDEAKKLGMEAWAYDENGWPSGFAGGELLRDPQNHACGLICETVEAFPDPAEDLLGVYSISDQDVVRLNAPDGSKEYTVVRRTRDFSYVDTMNPAVTQQFIEATHERYRRELGEDFGTTMPGFFTDEPQYFRNGTPWSDCFLTTFRERFGYDVRDNLPALFMDCKGAEEFRFDYYLHCHRSFYEGFMKPIYDWCTDHGVKLTGHGIEEWGLSDQMHCCGGVMPFYLYEHIPGIDYLGRNVKNVSGARQLGSVCAQTGKKVALTESFAACGWDVSPRELKRIAELQMAGGANLICEHLYAYSERGERKRDYPHHFSEHSPWHREFKQFETHFQHLGAALSQGSELADVLVIHPMHSAYLHFIKNQTREKIEALERSFSYLVERLSNDQISYHFGDETILGQLGSVEGDRIRVGECSYRYVVIPDCETLDSSTVALLQTYLAQGGKVCVMGEHPSRVDGRISDMGFLQSNLTYEDLKKTSGVTVSSDGAGVPLHLQIRKTDAGRLIFLANTTPNAYRNTEIRVENCQGLMELCTETLALRPLRGRCHSDGSVTVLYDFEDSASCLLVECEADLLPFEKSEEMRSISLPNNFRLLGVSENALLMDRARISLNGGAYSELYSWSRIRDELLNDRFEGRIDLRYSFKVKTVPSSLRLVTEPLGGMTVTVNGREVALESDGRIDPRFLGADILPFVKTGDNDVVVSFDYVQRQEVYDALYGGGSETLRNCLTFDTEIEPIYLFGDFRVYSETEWTSDQSGIWRNAGDFFLDGRKDTVNLKNFNQDGFVFFRGTVRASTTFTYQSGDPTTLVLGGRFATCGVEINGINLGVQLFSDAFDLAPYLREGENEITLTLCFSNRNLFGPHHRITAEPNFVGPFSFTFEKCWKNGHCERFREDYSFVKWGVGFDPKQ